MPTLYNVKSQNNAMSANVAEKLMEWTANATHTSDDVRLLYATLNLRGVGGSGECLRPRTQVYGTSVPSAHGMHCTLVIAVGGAISGLGCGLRATFEAATATRTLGGTLCALQVDSYIAAGNTLPGAHAFIRVSDEGAVRMTNLLQIPNASNGTIFAAHTTQTMTHSIKIISHNGTPYYVMCCDAATNRS
jgi:hypothetical protein